ncbi:hypothetical protein STRDD11_00369 [Streptococcus sp. DD11]|nr:hypothetical protein STRDD11_00369 [Streptococcus sp. DD11]
MPIGNSNIFSQSEKKVAGRPVYAGLDKGMKGCLSLFERLKDE